MHSQVSQNISRLPFTLIHLNRKGIGCIGGILSSFPGLLRLLASTATCIALYYEANMIARPLPIILEHKRPTTPSKYRGERVRRVCVSNQDLLPSPSAQTIISSKTPSSLLDFLISCHRGQKVESWTVFNITSEEVQTV